VIPIKDHPAGATFAVKVHPRAKRDRISGVVGDALKLDLIAPPVEGRANEACIRFFADFLKVPRSSVTIASGANTRLKVIRIAGITAEQVRQRLSAAEIQ
jgi:uncharacterized protein (TIGR00251 family)